MENVVVDRRRGHERPQTVLAADQLLALEQLQGLAQGHQRDAELARHLALIGQPRAGRQLTTLDSFAELFGDAVVPGDTSDHRASGSRTISPLRCSRTLSA